MGKFAIWIARLHNAGIRPDDSEELRLHKSLLMLATGLISIAPVLWLALYWSMGLNFSATLPIVYQLVSLIILGVYLHTGSFLFFRTAQLCVFLFVPFIVQWGIGSFVSASGVILWGLLAPVGAMLFVGVRESVAWFFAYVVFVALSAVFDYYLPGSGLQVPLKISAIFFALNFIAVSTIVYLLLRYSASEKDRMKAKLKEAHTQLIGEQELSERLLLNILPGSVAERLKRDDTAIADGFADVTVMFADIVNFTQIAEGLSPNQIFSMLNKVFSSFDERVETHGVEKIKTIGDAYMVAGGLSQDSTDYSDAIADLALEMRDLIAEHSLTNKMPLEIRMGIGTGPVIAGVVGKKKFIYDLWGDTVNIASRITAEGVPGMIQVDATTYRRLRHRYDFFEPQTIYLKGKGEMVVYRLIGKKSAVSLVTSTQGEL